jgi:hypothetical protein
MGTWRLPRSVSRQRRRPTEDKGHGVHTGEADNRSSYDTSMETDRTLLKC